MQEQQVSKVVAYFGHEIKLMDSGVYRVSGFPGWYLTLLECQKAIDKFIKIKT